MVTLDPVLVNNLSQAYATADLFAAARGVNLWDVRDVMTCMLVTESGGGYIYANNGEGFREPDSVANRTPWNWNSSTGQPIGTPASRAAMRAKLKQSMDPAWLKANNLHYDKVGSNGRSTGPAQQLSEDVGGAWGPMAGTMRMSSSMVLFLSAVDWKNRDVVYKGKVMANWQTAMLLRVQQPLASEVATNYGAGQLASAQAIARDSRFDPAKLTSTSGTTIATPTPQGDEFDMANLNDVTNAVGAALKGVNSSLSERIPPLFQVYRSASADGDYAGKILLASSDHSYWITDINVLTLARTVGLAETGTRQYDNNVLRWIESITNAKELPVGDPAEVVKALEAARKAEADKAAAAAAATPNV